MMAIQDIQDDECNFILSLTLDVICMGPDHV